MEAQNNSLEIQLKEANERSVDVTLLQEHTLMIKRKTYQVQLKLAEEAYKIKQALTRLQEISAISTNFRTRTLEVAEIIQH